MSPKFIKKYMRLAKLVGEDQNPCYSRSIGVILVDPVENRVLATGYNGPPRGTPHCDDEDYLRQIVWPQLTDDEIETAMDKIEEGDRPDDWPADIGGPIGKDIFALHYKGCKTCHRKLIGAKSGERLEICSCEHSEKNAIANSSGSLWGSWAFCWCGVPCWDCSKLMINSGIKNIVSFNWGADYSLGSRWLLQKAGVEIDIREPEFFLND